MLNAKVKGGALYIALIISIVIGITLSIFILIGFYNQKQVLSQIGLQQLSDHLKSAFQIAQSEYFSEEENNRWIPIGSENDSVRIKTIQWGAYQLISTEAKNNHTYLKQCGLFGELLPKDTALLVCENGRPIHLSGKIKFNGYCYFPKSGYKPVFVEGQSFNTTSPIHSLLKPAPAFLPLLKKNFVEAVKKTISGFNPQTDSLVDFLPEALHNNFSAKTATYHSGTIHLLNHTLSGNLKLIADHKLTIEKTNHLDNILLIASTIRIKKGFTGTLNIIASDSIIIEEDCVLNYPSSLVLFNNEEKQTRTKTILAGSNSKIFGSLICANTSEKANTSNEMIKLNAGCEVYGLIYSSGYAHLQGSVFGTAMCSKLLMTSASAVYENHMMDCEIDPKKHANSLVVAGLFKDKSVNKCCKWL